MKRHFSTCLFVSFLYCAPALGDVIPGCGLGWAPDTVTFVPNVQSFLDYSNARGLGWTEAQIRREIVAAAEEWNAS